MGQSLLKKGRGIYLLDPQSALTAPGGEIGEMLGTNLPLVLQHISPWLNQDLYLPSFVEGPGFRILFPEEVLFVLCGEEDFCFLA